MRSVFQMLNLVDVELQHGPRCVEYFGELHWAQNMFQILVSWRAPTWAQDMFQILNILESSIGPKYVSDFHILESSNRGPRCVSDIVVLESSSSRPKYCVFQKKPMREEG